MADEYGPRGVRVVSLLPGRIMTDRNRELFAATGDAERAAADAAAAIPLGRLGDPAEFGRVAAFVLSPAASYLTGITLPVDGGALRRPVSRPITRPTRRRPGGAAAADRTIPDLIGPDLRVLFSGINPGLYSAATGHHFARPGNRFWPALHRSGFTDRQLHPSSRTSCSASASASPTWRPGRPPAPTNSPPPNWSRAAPCWPPRWRRYRPRWLAVLGVTAYRTAFGRPKAVIGRSRSRAGARSGCCPTRAA